MDFITDSKGYRFIKNGSRIVSTSNPFSLYNISNWIFLNRNDVYLVDGNEYFGNSKKLIFHCLKCDNDFSMSWGCLSKGQKCSVCEGRQVRKNTSLLFLYPFLCEEWDESNPFSPDTFPPFSNKTVSWRCRKCDYVWNSTINNRTGKSKGCPSCSGRATSDSNRLTIFYPEVSSEWNYKKNKKLPSEFSYGSNKKVWWICKNCSFSWFQKISSRTIEETKCPNCSICKGESSIKKYLDENNMDYVSQKRFDGCRNKKPLPFDFYLPCYNLCIEYNGQQHYQPFKFFGGDEKFKERKMLDKIKINYCKNNGILLLIISYKEFKNIEKILSNTFIQLS